MEVSYHFHALVVDGQLLFGCNLRHMAEQSERHPGDKISQWGGRRALATWQLFTLITHEGEQLPRLWLAGKHLLTPFFNRTGFCSNLDIAKTFVCRHEYALRI